MGNKERLDLTVKDLRELIRLKEDLEAEIESTKDIIKSYMRDHETDIITGVDYKITWNEVTTRRIDTRALKKELPDIASRYTKESKTRRFLIA